MSSRARGCLLGQLVGDALGSLVEFQSPEQIRRAYPAGVRELVDGGVWDTIAGQPTDDSEMAWALADSLIGRDEYDAAAARQAYRSWLDSEPFDCGTTVAAGLRGRSRRDSQANGALMRVSPLGIFGSRFEPTVVEEWARADARLTHPHPVCCQVDELFAGAIAFAVRESADGDRVRTWIEDRAAHLQVEETVERCLLDSASSPPADTLTHAGWVLIAFQNALWQLGHAPSFEEALVDTISRGGDTDTNAAICGSLLGAVHGVDAIPLRWREIVLACRPDGRRSGVRRPRPQRYWPGRALELADRLAGN